MLVLTPRMDTMICLVVFLRVRPGIFQRKIFQQQSQILRRMFHLNPRTLTKDVLVLARGKNGKIAPIEFGNCSCVIMDMLCVA